MFCLFSFYYIEFFGIPIVYVHVFVLFEFSVPREFREAILLAVTPTKHCVGIKVFDHSYVSDQNGNVDNDYDSYIDRCVREAAEIKKAIELGMYDMHEIENDPKIVRNPNCDQFDIDNFLELRAKSKICLLWF